MEKQILEALAQADVEDDEQWTADGAIRVDFVENLTGVALTRADITNVAPKFNRKNPITDVEEDDSDFPEVVSGEDEIGSNNPWAKSAEQIMQFKADEEESIADATKELEVVNEELASLIGKRKKLNEQIATLESDKKDLVAKTAKKPLTLKQQLDLVRASEAKAKRAERERNAKIAEAIKTLNL